MPIIHWQDAATRPRGDDPDGFAKQFVNRDMGATKLQMHVSSISPGKRAHPPHKHVEEEIIYVLSGSGTMQIDEEFTQVGKDSATFLPSWVFHGIENTGDEMLTYVVILEPKREE
ncbi:cupin domain-containing protein [Candidatus Poribacteria bacterium]|nr:cupin domain-containing protein [Candidatus Poribacteria bacterium]